MPSDNTIIIQEIRARGVPELESLLAGKTEDLHNANFKRALNQITQTHRLKQIRKDIARIRTVLNEKAVASQTVESGT
jgi:large subunit ribosomal protein L29